MESTKFNLLSWIEISKKVDNEEDLNPIDQFIYDNSPTGKDESKFREQLFNALGYENEETKTDRNANVVASFIEHCKEEGVELSDTLFESYFDA